MKLFNRKLLAELKDWENHSEVTSPNPFPQIPLTT